MSLYQRGDTWWISLVHNGQRIRQSARTSSKREAQRQHDELKARLWQQRLTGATLADAVKLWLTQSERTERERSALRVFLAIYPNRPLNRITGSDIAEALRDKKPATANRTINIIRAALNLAVRHNLAEHAPDIPRRQSPPGRLRWLTQQEWHTLRHHLPAHLQPAADFALATGLRRANVFGLRWSQIDLKRKVAWVDASETKTRRAIGVPLSDTALTALRLCLGQHPEYVFTFPRKVAGKIIRSPIGSPKTAWNAAIRRAGMAPATWHDLRHTWASWHVQNGTPLAVLRELGGWSSMDMVNRYAHLAPDHVQAWANNAAPRAVTKTVTRRRRV